MTKFYEITLKIDSVTIGNTTIPERTFRETIELTTLNRLKDGVALTKANSQFRIDTSNLSEIFKNYSNYLGPALMHFSARVVK